MNNEVIDVEAAATMAATHYAIGRVTSCTLIRAGFNHNYLIEAS